MSSSNTVMVATGSPGSVSREQGRKENINSLRQLQLFAALDDTDFEEMCSGLIERRYPRGTVVIEEGMPGDFMYLVQEGRVKVTQASTDGRERILDLREAGDFFGEVELVDGRLRETSVITLERTRLMALSRASFLDLLSRNAAFSLVVLKTVIQRLNDANARSSSICFDDVHARTWSVLKRLAAKTSPDREEQETPPLTHQQLADMIGASRETVTRAISQLKRRRALTQVGKRYRVHPG